MNKVLGPHRDVIIPKLEGRMDVFAKKLRDFYIREGVVPNAKIYVDTLRDRRPEDTIEKCVSNKEVVGKFVVSLSFRCYRRARRVQGYGPCLSLERSSHDQESRASYSETLLYKTQ